MQNGTGGNPERSTHPLPFGTPDGDLVVYAGTSQHRYAAPLNRLTDGTSVIAAGLVDGFKTHGTMDAPRATFVLVNDLGHATYAALDTDTLDLFSAYMDGSEVSVSGLCRRPFQDGPPYIQVIRVEPLAD